jgi:hypothetical protein
MTYNAVLNFLVQLKILKQPNCQFLLHEPSHSRDRNYTMLGGRQPQMQQIGQLLLVSLSHSPAETSAEAKEAFNFNKRFSGFFH